MWKKPNKIITVPFRYFLRRFSSTTIVSNRFNGTPLSTHIHTYMRCAFGIRERMRRTRGRKSYRRVGWDGIEEWNRYRESGEISVTAAPQQVGTVGPAWAEPKGPGTKTTTTTKTIRLRWNCYRRTRPEYIPQQWGPPNRTRPVRPSDCRTPTIRRIIIIYIRAAYIHSGRIHSPSARSIL